MGRHSRGGGSTPPPEPEPPAPTPRYAPRSPEDTGVWDHSTYRVVDVGLPATPPPPSGAAFPLGGRPLRSVPEEPARGRRRAGATRADLAPDPYAQLRAAADRRNEAAAERWAPSPGRGGATRADLTTPPSRAGNPSTADSRLSDSGSGLRRPDPRPSDPGPARHPDPRLSDTGTGLRRPDPRLSDTGSGLRRPSDTGAGLRPLGADPRASSPGLHPLGTEDTGSRLRRPQGGSAPGPSDTGSGLRPPDADPRRSRAVGRADTGAGLRPLGGADTGSGLRPLGRDPRASSPGLHPLGPADTGSGLRPLGADPRASSPGLHPLGNRGGSPVHPLASPPAEEEPDRRRSRSAARDKPADRPGERRRGADRRGADRRGPDRRGADRHGADRHGVDRHGVDRHGATRADLAGTHGSAALAPAEPEPLPSTAPEPDEVTDTGARRTRSTFHVAEDPDPDEPSLLLQWGVFVAQTLTGAAVGLGAWLGFYRLWSTFPLYAAPAVGVTTIGMLGVAQILRRRHGHDLDLLTATVTIAVATVLTVLPAAFTLQSLA